jgi:uncharacterized protein YndB with AHSA1/START domain
MQRMATVAEEAIEREIRVRARPETVFAFWTDPAKIVRWMGRTARLDPRPGGEFRIEYSGSYVASGTYLEVDRPNRVVLTWGWEEAGDLTPQGASTVEVTFTADGDDTILRLRHSGLVPGAVAGHAEGWDHFLPALAASAEAPPAEANAG